MFSTQLVINFYLFIYLFILGIFGILTLTNRRHFLVVIICIAMLLFSINMFFLLFSVQIDDFFFLILAVESSLEFIMSTFVVHCDSGSPDKTGVTALGFALFFGISLLYIRNPKVITHIIKDSSGESFWTDINKRTGEKLATGTDRYGITRYFWEGDNFTAKHSLSECLDLNVIVGPNGFTPSDLAPWYSICAHTPGQVWYVMLGFGVLSCLAASELSSYKSYWLEAIGDML